MEFNDRLIVALDFDTFDQARGMVDSLGESARFYKIGLRLFTREGPKIVRELADAGKKIFLDLKLHEIPNSVAGAVNSAGALGVSMLTVHASAGSAALAAAVDTAQKYPGLQIIAVTVVTSLRDGDLREIGINATAQEQVLRLATLAERAGCHGVVASPHEAAMLRKTLSPHMAIVTPGIRVAGDAANDQSRIGTPAQALRAGATHLVVGRSITGAAKPRLVIDQIYAEIKALDV